MINIRFANENDTELILNFIKSLAKFEKLEDKVTADLDLIHESIFGEKRYCEVIIAENNSIPAGFALFFHNFSTFLAKPGLYLEDLYVEEKYRGLGIGKALLKECAKIAIERNCGRFEWSVLDWNPAREFYEHLGAVPLNDWIVYRLTGDNLTKLAYEKE